MISNLYQQFVEFAPYDCQSYPDFPYAAYQIHFYYNQLRLLINHDL